MIPSNPMDGVKRPTAEKNKAKFYDDEEAQLLDTTLNKEPSKWRLYFLGCLIGGFRRGELIAVQWSDLNFEENTISINKSISVSKIVDTTKMILKMRSICLNGT
ncbi:hypothetical protein ACJ7K1_24540 [Paenibacillus elgii]